MYLYGALPRRHSAADAVGAAAMLPKLARHDSYRLRFDLEQHFNAKVYTSGSAVKGRVVLEAFRDVHFDKLEICLIGVSTTQNFLQHESGIVATPFMKLLMPLARNSLPPDEVFRAGNDYSFAFNFIVPFHLTIGACRHKCTSPAVREQHLRPPPTMGFWDVDDQSPQMTQIRYAISVVATKKYVSEYLPVRVMEGSYMIRVLPAFPEDAPLDITSLDDQYALSKSKTIRKNYVASKLGRLTATAAQPKALMLSPDGHAVTGTSCRLKLAFASTGGDIPPPKINSVSGKLATHTYFDVSFLNRLPNLGNRRTYEAMSPYEYATSIRLFTLPMGNMSWKEERSSLEDFMFSPAEPSSTDQLRRTSAATCPEMSGTSRNYVSDLDIQFTVPDNNKIMYLPTFHSCRISRAYILELSLSLGQTFTTLSLAVPLQIGVEESHNLPRYERVQFGAELAFVGGNELARRNTDGAIPGAVMNASDNELPDYY
ncbi:hypothetical protein QQS21_000724 [Conoideocrella luteorostrata]|uniref:Arrestin n=1 Tax=Conoideocrella luteorostrata TaxID=1105319 RepID=A0AAJ0D0W4_9HYPO|nr:hypothetical protein QQS21_000724 [Conoideocrella luteorostrata]